MPSAVAAASALARSRDAIATISVSDPRCIAGITFFTAMPATPSTPHRSLCTAVLFQGSKALAPSRARPASRIARQLRQRQRRLPEHVPPSRRRPYVGVAEPQLALERLAVGRPLQPQQRGHDRRVAPHADLLFRVFLVFVDR